MGNWGNSQSSKSTKLCLNCQHSASPPKKKINKKDEVDFFLLFCDLLDQFFIEAGDHVDKKIRVGGGRVNLFVNLILIQVVVSCGHVN